MESKFMLSQNDKGHWDITIYRRVNNQLVRVNKLTCLDLEAVREVLDMLNGSAAIIIEEAS
jgi:hypothetical protein